MAYIDRPTQIAKELLQRSHKCHATIPNLGHGVTAAFTQTSIEAPRLSILFTVNGASSNSPGIQGTSTSKNLGLVVSLKGAITFSSTPASLISASLPNLLTAKLILRSLNPSICDIMLQI